ncbi:MULTISPECIES: hypothetical protein [unclassified Streptomyces]|uniref:hypothetical protein n=1 Tax=unclassified Streptomyces TaxID=2593676 RepID=UPI000DC7EA90|nr:MULTISPECIES: hypothetical protein [unclassified Streptomyces]AWZ05968.1 hypothetical protein DRB89_16525 [Streptomyces sp. ICC4]AWZ11662.1 hypothetical protein DRB96_04300 [Streptomyces sp. ICC1]
MTAQDRVTVNDARGPVNNGPGPQYVIYGARAARKIRRTAEPLRIVREDRLYLADRFAPPVNYRVAADRLEKPGSVVLLDAQPGTGRRAAAIMLLHELGEDGDTEGEDVRFEELPTPDKPTDGDGDGDADADADADAEPAAPGAGDLFLLDLSRIADEEAYAEAQHRLARLRSQVQEAGAHLVVVLPSGMMHAHPPELAPHTVTLERPRGIAVINGYLRMDLMSFRPADLERPDLRFLCDRSPMRELARLAGLVRTARDSGRFGTDFTSWLDQALSAVTGRATEVRERVTAASTAPERALLLAAAVFEEAHADTVHEAWRGLLKTVGHEEEAATELARMDFGQRLTALGIDRGPDGRIRFEQLAYAEAVRTYFWTNFPGLRDKLAEWIGVAAGLPGLTTDDRVNVVVRFGERSLAAGRPDDLFDLAALWANGAAGASSDPRAVAALELGLSHEGFGVWFRRRMYDCVHSTSLSDGLVRALTAACVQSLASTHPDQAVVRLRHLAVREGEAARAAGEALFGLVGNDRRLYRLLIDRLRVPARRESRAAEPPLRLLTELLRSDRVPDPPRWPVLFLGWETVFSQPPTKLWDPLVKSWLDTVAGDRTREMALELMVGATHGRTIALHRLYAIACDWAGAARDPVRTAAAARLWQHIDQAQYARADRTQRAGNEPRTTEEAR